MVKVSAFEFECRIDRVHSAIASAKSAQGSEHIAEVLRLHKAIQLLVNASLKRENERLKQRASSAVSAAYAYINSTIESMVGS